MVFGWLQWSRNSSPLWNLMAVLTRARHCRFTESDEFSPHYFLRLISILFSHPYCCPPSDYVPSGLPTKFLYSFLMSIMHATWPTPSFLHLITRHLENSTTY
jgi:hypothetical protein